MRNNTISMNFPGTVFFKDPYTNQIISGKVVDMTPDKELVVEADVNENKTSHARFRLRSLEIFKTKDEIIAKGKTHVNTMLETYKAEITDLESLLDFPEKHVFDDSSEGYTAMCAYRERKTEILDELNKKEN